jgi:hypothetical protein
MARPRSPGFHEELAGSKSRGGPQETRRGKDKTRNNATRSEKNRAEHVTGIAAGRHTSRDGAVNIRWDGRRESSESDLGMGATLYGADVNTDPATASSTSTGTAAEGTAATSATATSATAAAAAAAIAALSAYVPGCSTRW